MVGHDLICPLDDGDSFSIDHTLRRSMYGNIEPVKNGDVTRQAKFIYTVSLHFEETLDKGTTSRYLERDEINRLLAGRSAVPCKVIMSICFFKPCYSKTMLVPVSALLREVNK